MCEHNLFHTVTYVRLYSLLRLLLRNNKTGHSVRKKKKEEEEGSREGEEGVEVKEEPKKKEKEEKSWSGNSHLSRSCIAELCSCPREWASWATLAQGLLVW